ncbi:MAG: tRNA uridine-5-carboxymethylaminomethyl(34) synthesis GTPase MnmE [Eubacteriaceae bacterium]|jgi:tRNA modification GTPase|nr:tRNA uridine-5-carboxymethylaminomethyl(34) synthesis GTPase MnmE [Eubacteriaceae bacterium]
MHRQYLSEDTIAAVATGMGSSGIGIIRISGPEAVSVASKIFTPKGSQNLETCESHKLLYGHIVDPQTAQRVDEVLVSKMKAPHTYTREDVVEINCHGGIVPMQKTLALVLQEGVRLAEPGEFTKRAFLNGRLDLTQAEAVMDIIGAKSEKNLQLSLYQLEGALSKSIDAMEDTLIDLLSFIEANIDYPEYDIEEVSETRLVETVSALVKKTKALLEGAQTGRIYKEGIATLILGEPNVGKSSLLNALLMSERAIVTEIPGTTRDIIEETVTIQGIPFKLIDTAGIRETDNIVEQIGVDKAVDWIERADLILFMHDINKPIDAEDQALLDLVANRQTLYLANKADNLNTADEGKLGSPWMPISVLEGHNIDRLKEQMAAVVLSGKVSAESDFLITNVRHIRLLELFQRALEQALETLDSGMPLEMISIDLQDALAYLREISGKQIDEAVIHRIFENFCVGK